MNKFDKNNSIKELLEKSAENTKPNPMFVAQLEQTLKKAHRPRMSFSLPTFTSFTSLLARTGMLAILAFVLMWMFKSFQPQVGTNDTFICPVTTPNESIPPGENAAYENYLGNDKVWTSLWPNGKIHMQPYNRNPDGSLSMKWPWWRSVSGPLSIEGRRLDAEAEPLRSFISSGYGESGLQVSELIFPTTGCWEVTGHVGNASLTFVTEVVYSEVTPEPEEVDNIALSPTVNFEPIPTSTVLLFQDDFSGVLDKDWQWLREDNRYWSLINNDGWLEITAGFGSISGGNINNLLLREVPQQDFELETKLQFKPAEGQQIAGLLIYENAANFIQFGRGLCDAPQCVGDGFYFEQMTHGILESENFATPAADLTSVYLRLRLEKNVFSAYSSENGKEWKLIGAHNNKINPLYVGLIAGQSFNRVVQIPAQFDYFVINGLSDQP